MKELFEEANISLHKKTYTKAEVEEMLGKLAVTVAKECMDSIVENMEFNNRAEGAWWTIRDTYDIEINNQMEMLPNNRSTPKEIEHEFIEACHSGNIEQLSQCFKKGARIVSVKQDGDCNVFLNICSWGPVETIHFFMTSPETQFQRMDLNHNASQILENCMAYGNLPILQYLINEHQFDMLPNTKKAMTEDFYLTSQYKPEVENFIAKKELYKDLQGNLSTKENKLPKSKI